MEQILYWWVGIAFVISVWNTFKINKSFDINIFFNFFYQYTIKIILEAIGAEFKKSLSLDSKKSNKCKKQTKKTLTVKVNNGRVEEYLNGALKRTYGTNVLKASTDGDIVVILLDNERIEEYINGSKKRSFGTSG